MTDSQSMLTTLLRDTEERIDVQRREIGLLRSGAMRVQVTLAEGEQDISATWLARLEEWLASDEALLKRLHSEPA